MTTLHLETPRDAESCVCGVLMFTKENVFPERAETFVNISLDPRTSEHLDSNFQHNQPYPDTLGTEQGDYPEAAVHELGVNTQRLRAGLRTTLGLERSQKAKGRPSFWRTAPKHRDCTAQRSHSERH